MILNKALPLLVSPIGLCMLIAAVSVLLKRYRGVWLALGLLWVCSMPLTAHHLIRAVEQHAVRLAPAEMPQADVIVVLGGMTGQVQASPTNSSKGDDGRAVLPPITREWSEAVDRYSAALALWRNQRAPLLVFTAGQLPWQVSSQSEGHWLAEQARAEGIPPEAIEVTGPVQNTADEARAVRALMKERQLSKALLVTSAFHMPRAAAQFATQGVTVTPYPVDLRSGPRQFTVLDVLPEAGALQGTSLAVREWLGRAYHSLRSA